MHSRPLALAVLLTACGAPQADTRPALAAASPPAKAALATLDGETIGRGDLDPALERRLAELENEVEQRKLHLLWSGVEQVIGERLMRKEAERRAVTPEALREEEVLAKVAPPSPDEIRRFYDQNEPSIGVPFDAAEPHIKNELMTERLRAQERAYVDELRQKSDVRYSLPAPELPRQKLDPGAGPSWGKREAKVVIVEFSDFECPYCGRASVLLNHLKELYPNDVRVEFRNFPLGQHRQARDAAEAAVCADEQGRFWEYHDMLFANANALAQADLRRYAEGLGLDLGALDACLASERPRQSVDASLALGRAVGVEGTPAIYVNGIKLIGLLPLPVIRAFIDRELGR